MLHKLTNISLGDYTDLLMSTKDINFTQTLRGGRQVAYFGQQPYKYGDYNHAAQPYPDCKLFDSIFNRLHDEVDSEITRDNYTCLVTLYENGGVEIPRHSDVVDQVPGKTIYEISVGAPRKLTFINSSGPLNEHDVLLDHGTVYAMTEESQADWSHEIKPDPSVKDPRISFTLRRLSSPGEKPKASVPPIQPPGP